MLSTAIIVFREVLEIALVLGVLMAATRGIAHRNKWVLAGITGGVIGSGLVALFAETIANAVEGMGQEVFNATVLFLAAAMIGWTVVWMRRHGRNMTAHLKKVGQAVSDGELPLYSMAVVITLAVLREGSEIVLFTYGTLAAGTSIASVLAGAALGLGIGTIVGVILYFGLVNIATKHLFAVTSWLLAFLAAGMAAQATGFLAAAGIVPELVPILWDSSALLPEGSLAGQVLHVLIGYTERPSGMQALAYIVVLGVIAACLRTIRPASPSSVTPKVALAK